jgi:hypothetical protein
MSRELRKGIGQAVAERLGKDGPPSSSTTKGGRQREGDAGCWHHRRRRPGVAIQRDITVVSEIEHLFGKACATSRGPTLACSTPGGQLMPLPDMTES